MRNDYEKFNHKNEYYNKRQQTIKQFSSKINNNQALIPIRINV